MAVPTERNVMASTKIAKEVAAAVEMYRLETCTEPMNIPPHCLAVSPNNRGGQPLTLMVVHQNIIRSFLEDGFDSTRPPVGIVIWFSTTEAKAAAVAHNVRLFGGSALFPPVESDEVKGVTLLCSHFNVALRCFRAQMQTVDSSG